MPIWRPCSRAQPGHEGRAVERLELVERHPVARRDAVAHAGDHLARVERFLEVGGDQVEQLVGVGVRLGEVFPPDLASPGGRACRDPLPPVQPRDDPPPDPDGVPLVDRQVVGEPGGPGVHLRTAERLVVGLLAGRHLDQGRAAEEHLGLLLDHHDVVAHARDIGAARRAVAEHQRDRGSAGGAGLGEPAEQRAAGDEDLLLRRQVGAAGLHQVDRREPVLAGDLRCAEQLLHRPRVARAAAHRRVVGDHQALDTLDDPDAGHDARAHREVRPPAGQRGQLQERRALVDEQLDAFAGQQLAAGVVPVDVLLAAAGHRLRVLRVQRRELLEHRRPP